MVTRNTLATCVDPYAHVGVFSQVLYIYVCIYIYMYIYSYICMFFLRIYLLRYTVHTHTHIYEFRRCTGIPTSAVQGKQ